MIKANRFKSMGFTLVELMIVVGIVAILSAIALPRFGDMLEKANHGATIGNLAAIRSAIVLYQGSYLNLPDDIGAQNSLFSEIIDGALPGVKARYPLLNSPFGNSVVTGNLVPDSAGTGWYYENRHGYVFINSIEKDVYGKSYTIY